MQIQSGIFHIFISKSPHGAPASASRQFCISYKIVPDTFIG